MQYVFRKTPFPEWKGYFHILHLNYRDLCSGSPALLALVAAQPCRLLATALRLVDDLERAPSPPSAHHRMASQSIRATAVTASSVLLLLTALSGPGMAVLGPQLAVPGLWGLVCAAAAAEPIDPLQLLACADRVATIFAKFQQPAAGVALPGCSSPLAPAICAALAAEEGFWALLLRAAAVRDPRPAPGVMEALNIGLAESNGAAASLLIQTILTPQHVIDIAAAVPGVGAPRKLELYVIHKLYGCLQGHADAQRAFLAVAACAQHVLALALRCGPTSAYARADAHGRQQEVAAFCRVAISVPAILITIPRTMELSLGLNPRATAEWKGMATRARWMAQRGVVGTCEALLRANAERTESAPGGPTSVETGCALNVAVLLLDDSLLGPDATGACLSLFASQRKAMLRWVATLAAAPALHSAAAATAAAAAGTAAADSTSTPPAAAPAVSWRTHDTSSGGSSSSGSGNSSRSSSSRSSSSSSSGGSLTALNSCLQRCDLLFSVPCLTARLSAGCPAARRLLAGCVRQLLPLVVKTAVQRLRIHPPGLEDCGAWLHLVVTLQRFHKWGLLDITAAASVPALLSRLLCALPRQLPKTVFLLDGARETVRLGAASAAWLRETARLSLLKELTACAAGLQGDVALAALLARNKDPARVALARLAVQASSCLPGQPATAAQEVQRYMVTAVHNAVSFVRGCEQEQTRVAGLALPACSLGGTGALWDRHLLLSRHTGAPNTAEDARAVWLGCCHRGCTNVSGSTEAALKLRRCKGCRLAGYCSTACQRKAWRSGHRAACLDWQAQQVLLDGEST